MNHYNGGPIPPGYPLPQYPPPGNPWRTPIRRNANIVCFGLTLVVLLSIFLAPVFTALSDFITDSLGLTSRSVISSLDMLGELFAYILIFLIPMVIIRLWIGIPPWAAFPMRKTRREIALPAVFACLGTSVAGMLAYGTLASFLERVFGIVPYMPEMPLPAGWFAASVYFLRMTAVPAVLEEMMFRGVIMQSLRRYGDMFALVCSSIMFSLAHHNLVQGPNALLVGLVIGFFVLRLGSLRVGMLMHFINNALAVAVSLSTRTLTQAQSEVVTMLLLVFYAASGVVALLYLVSAHGGMFRLAPSGYPMTEGAKYNAFFVAAMPIIYMVVIAVVTCFQFR